MLAVFHGLASETDRGFKSALVWGRLDADLVCVRFDTLLRSDNCYTFRVDSCLHYFGFYCWLCLCYGLFLDTFFTLVTTSSL